MPNGKQITLEKYLQESGIEEDLQELILTLSEMSVRIRAEFSIRRGSAGTWNPSGEEQMSIDKWANDFVVRKLSKTGLVNQIASEEMEDIFMTASGKYSVTIDPLDGSSNIESNNVFGTIVGIYEGSLPQKGRNLKAAFYKVYGPITSMILTLGQGVAEFIEVSRGASNYILTKENMQFPEPPKVYGAGGNKREWLPEFMRFVQELELRNMKTRYGGALVGDFNQVLCYGGIFCYPGTFKRPIGKLRLIFEAYPISFIAEQAGGKGSNGKKNILDIEPQSLHQRTPLFVGNKSLVEEYEKLVEQATLARSQLDS